MTKNTIRPVAICIFRKEDKILVFEAYDKVDDEIFYRPLGGGIEFGEHSSETVVREIREEINAEICNLSFMTTIENIFMNNGEPGHEIVQIYEAVFCEKTFYEQEKIEVIEDDGTRLWAYWKSIDFFKQGKAPLCPEGLLLLFKNN